MDPRWLDTAWMAATAILLIVLLGIAWRRARLLRKADIAALAEGEAEAPDSLDAAREAEAEAPAAAPEAELQPVAPRDAPAAAPAAPAVVEAEPDAALEAGLARSREGLWGRLSALLRGGALDDALIEDLEAVLLTSDVGVAMTERLLTALREQARSVSGDPEAVRALLREQLRAALATAAPSGEDPLQPPEPGQKPKVILFVGVNGVGKTTTIGKVAHLLAGRGHKVVLAAGDTFRAAAAEQLEIWGTRTGARVVRGAERADPASVMFNAMQAAQADGADFLLADTAGRLHTNAQLMDEIKKVRRALGRLREGAPEQTWLVVDATTGQNALHQAREFHQALGLTGLILTKLDGTAKGGIVVGIADALALPVRFVGVGEGEAALRPFDADAFVRALV